MAEERVEEYEYKPRGYTAIDFAYLAVVAVVSSVIFWAAWYVYDYGKIIGGPIGARLLSYGLWFIGAPLGATLVRKPLSAFLGETLGALIESFLPTAGGFTNLEYGIAQGLLSELVYAAFRYKRWDPLVAGLAGAAAAPAAVALDAILFQELFSPGLMIVMVIAAAISGFIYGYIAARAVEAVRPSA